jgi:two-component system nitrate/nitrite response regulator NarL
MSITVLLADDTPIMRTAIRHLLDEQPEIELVGEASNFDQTIELTQALKPQVVIFDLHMPHDESRLTMSEVRYCLQSSAVWILAISVWNDDDTRALARSFGANALLDKLRLTQELIPTVMNLAAAPAVTAGCFAN